MILFFDTETNGLWRRDLNPNHEDQPRLVSLAFPVMCKDDETSVVSIYDPSLDTWSIPKAASDVWYTTEEAKS